MTKHFRKNTTVVPFRLSTPKGLSEDDLKISSNALTILNILKTKNVRSYMQSGTGA
jgi:hypothetical protein